MSDVNVTIVEETVSVAITEETVPVTVVENVISVTPVAVAAAAVTVTEEAVAVSISSGGGAGYTDAEAVAAILAADGPGSSLDADTLDGTELASIQAEIDSDIATHTAIVGAHHVRYTNAEAVAAILAADGSGSGLDADLLDGQHGAYYVPISIVSGTPGRVAQFAAAGIEDANLIAPANLLTLAAADAYTFIVPATGTAAMLGEANIYTATQTFNEHILQANAKYIATDQIRARDGDGLKLYDDGGNGIFVKNGGYTGINNDDPENQCHVASESNASSRGLLLSQHNTGPQGAVLYFNKSRGTRTSPLIVADNDHTAFFANRVYDGASYQKSGGFGFSLDGVPSAGIVPCRIDFATTETAGGGPSGVGINRLSIRATGKIGVNENDPIAQYHVTVSGAAVIGQIIQLASSPSEAALEVRAFNDAVLAKLTETGGAEFSDLVDINSDILRLRTAKTPASAGAAGNQGDWCWDTSYLYVCTATNTWKRNALATW